MNARKQIAASLSLAALLLVLIAPAGAQASFGIKSVTAGAFNHDGSVDLQAGSHPFEYKVKLTMNQNGAGEPEGTLRDLVVELPPGMVGDPQAVPRCSGAAFEGALPRCPANTQIGAAFLRINGLVGKGPEGTSVAPIYNLTPPQGVPASIGFSVINENSFQEASLRPGDYGIDISDITVPTDKELQSITEVIWGVPADSAHDSQRSACLEVGGECPTDLAQAPFLSLPTSCAGPLQTTFKVKSVQEPDAYQSTSVFSLDQSGNPAGLNSCEKLPFEPTITAQPETAVSDSPSGLHVHIHSPQNQAVGQLATAHLKNVVLELPKGMAVNPSQADGLAACSLAQIDLQGSAPAQCPPASKVGTVRAASPLLDHPVKGAIYVAKQGENPFNSLIALYIAVEDPITGVVVKLAGRVEPDLLTGQLKTTFKNNPQLPIEDIDVELGGGPRAALTTPPTCGTYTTTADLTPWSTPEGADAFKSDSFKLIAAPGGGCVTSEAQMPNKPIFEAGTMTPLAGAYSPFVLKLSRENGSQQFRNLNVTAPPGLTAKLAGVDQCSDAQLAVAAARKQPGEGILEKQSPSCPTASQVGVVNVGAGSGTPFFVQGKAYLAGPYKGAPISLAIVTPAIAGPFDLGTVVVRSGLYVDPKTAQVTVKSDDIPQILEGIPLDVRTIAVQIDRSEFTLSPTSCEVMSVAGSLTSTTGQATSLHNRFQASGCKGLGFKPRFSLRLKGGTHRAANPKLIATLAPREGDANISALSVQLPRSAFLDQSHIRTVCTRVQFAADTCPPGSVYGKVSVQTPILGYPLKGNVYLRSSNHKLPDLVADLRGPATQPIRIQLSGRTDSVKGALRNSFDFLPDAPFSTARLELFGGKRGLVVNSRNLCAHDYRATVKYEAHNGKAYQAQPSVQSDCGKARKGKKHKRHSK